MSCVIALAGGYTEVTAFRYLPQWITTDGLFRHEKSLFPILTAINF